MKRMQKVIYSFILMVIIILQSLSITFAQQRERDHLILLDITGSMVGHGDGMGIDIFNDVKGYAKRYIDDVRIGEVLAIFPFEGGIRSGTGQYFFKLIESENDKHAAKSFVDNLIANGQRTWLTPSYESAIKQLEKFRDLVDDYNTSTREQIIVLYTDGKGNHVPTDVNIETFIDKFMLARNDFEHLYTKFIIIGEAGIAYKTEDIKKKAQAGIETVITRRLGQIIPINVRPLSLKFSNRLPKNQLQFDNVPVNYIGQNVAIGIKLHNEHNCLIDLDPNIVKLSNSSFEIKATLNLTEACLERLSETEKIEGQLTFSTDSTNIDFSTVSFEYNINKDKINFSLAEEDNFIIKDKGKFTLKVSGNENLDEYRIVHLFLVTDRSDEHIALDVKPNSFEIDKNTKYVKFSVNPETRKAYRSYARGLKEDFSREMSFLLSMNETPFVSLDDSSKSFELVHVIKKRLPAWINYILVGIIGAIIVLLLILKAVTARFPRNARIEDDDGRICGYLKPKFGKTHLTMGNSERDDIRVEGVGYFKSCKVYPHSNNAVRINKVSPKISLLDKEGDEKIQLLVNADDSFSIKDGDTTKSFYLYI